MRLKTGDIARTWCDELVEITEVSIFIPGSGRLYRAILVEDKLKYLVGEARVFTFSASELQKVTNESLR